MKLHEVYAQQMQNHSEGYAIYHPETTSTLRPGICGYFNDHGDWTPIVDLSDSEALNKAGYAALDAVLVKAALRPPAVWGPKASFGVRHKDVEAAFGASSVVVCFFLRSILGI